MDSTRDKAITQTGIFKVNAFVAEGCKGNPAGVCLLPRAREDDYYIKVAVKMAAAETAFIYEENDIYRLRWFTLSGREVALCGHATLAAAGILWDKGYVSPEKTIRFTTKSGILKAARDGDYITLDFPRPEITEIKNREQDIKQATGLAPLFIGQTAFDYLVVVGSEAAVKAYKPDFEQLKKLDGRGISITARAAGRDYDFVSRFFAPSIGINEDPVTGSAHCALAVYWGGVLRKSGMLGYQTSREGGMVRVDLLKDRVLLGGRTKETAIPAAMRQLILSW